MPPRVFSGLPLVHLTIVTLLVMECETVDKGNFKTCLQSAFCRRQRAIEPNASPYVVVMDSLQVDQSSIQLHILNTKTNIRLLLQLYNLQGNIVRLKINELNPLKPRYEVPDDLVRNGEIPLSGMKVTGRSSSSITVDLGSSVVTISQQPFRIDFSNNDGPITSFNAQGMFNFEHLRTKPEPPPSQDKEEDKEDENKTEDPPAEGEDQKADETKKENEDQKEEDAKSEEDSEGMWEETFGSHRDSKPNGPSSIGIDISFPGFEHVYGLPEHADSLALKSTKDTDPYRLYNLDVFEYELYNPMALYGSVPFMIAHNKQQTVGTLWVNTAEMWIDIRSNVADKTFFSKLATLVKGNTDIPQVDTHWMAESGVVDLFLMFGPSPRDVMKQYAIITGSTPLPPLFSMAYHQCRWNYNDQEDVLSVDSKFDEHDIPYDVIWLDIEHTNGKRYFTWDQTKFPDSLSMLSTLNQKGRKLVNVVDPHLKRDDDYTLYADANSKDLFVRDSSGSVFEGWCWSGTSCWPDFTKPATRQWWADQYSLDKYTGTDHNVHIWNDMNEPSVFNGPEITMHKDNIHDGGWEHRDVHNYFALTIHAATFQGIQQRSDPPLRPFVLTRGFFAGSQKFGAVWTGDNVADWAHLKMSLPMLLSLSISGITFCGADVGGFFKNPDPELLTRWYQAGSYQPFFRAHAHIDTRRREPWLQPEANMQIIREAIRIRYSLLPYWYTLFYENEQTGVPPMRPLWLEFPQDDSIYSTDDQHMIGSALLVKPIVEKGSQGTNVYFPGVDEVWYDVDNFKEYLGGQNVYIEAPLDKIPVFHRGGTIIPRRIRQRRSSSLTYHDPFTLFVALDKQGKSEGDIYVDDYNTYNYRSGQYVHKHFVFNNNILQSTHKDKPTEFETGAWIERVVILGMTKAPTSVHISSSALDRKQPLAFAFRDEFHLLIIRKPGINIAHDWSIYLQ